MSDYPDGTDYVEPKHHPHTDLWKDIPQSGEWVGRGKKRFWRRTSRGAITLPNTAARLAEHAELCGYVLDPAKAKIKRIEPARMGRSFTNPGEWVDVNAPEPPPNPVGQIAAQAQHQLTYTELTELHDKIGRQIEDMR